VSGAISCSGTFHSATTNRIKTEQIANCHALRLAKASTPSIGTFRNSPGNRLRRFIKSVYFSYPCCQTGALAMLGIRRSRKQSWRLSLAD
jgi:hypothetical protein